MTDPESAQPVSPAPPTSPPPVPPGPLYAPWPGAMAQPYVYPVPMMVAPKAPSNGLALAGMIVALGNIAFVLCCAPLGIIGGIVAISLGGVGLQRSKELAGLGRNHAITALWVGGVGVGLVPLTWIFLFAGRAMYGV